MTENQIEWARKRDELLKDADVFDHCFKDASKPVKEKEQKRYDALCKEFGL